VVPADLPADWAPPGVELLRDDGLTNDQLDASDGVLTGCALGIAQTGTIVLDHGALQGRRAITLLPDYHLATYRAMCHTEDRRLVSANLICNNVRYKMPVLEHIYHNTLWAV